jgi:hypothetical protein
MTTPHLTPSGVFLTCLVVWWLAANAALRTIEVVQFFRKMLRGGE